MSAFESEEPVTSSVAQDPPRRWTAVRSKALKALRAHPLIEQKLKNRPQYTDVIGDRRMLRFLEAEDYNIDLSAERVNVFLNYRDENKVDDIRNEILFTPLTNPGQFPCAEKILELTGHDIIAPDCTDAAGNPLATEYYAFDGGKFMEQVTKEEYIRFMLYSFELRNLCLEQLSHNKEKENLSKMQKDRDERAAKGESSKSDSEKPYGVLLRMNIIRDFSGLTLTNFAKTQGMTGWVVPLAKDCYPETLEKAYMTNTPWFFSSVWVVLKNVLDARVVSKMVHVKGDMLKVLPEEYAIPTCAIPSQLGGGYTGLNVDVNLPAPPTHDWDGADASVYKGPFGLRKVRKVRRGSSISSPSKAAAAAAAAAADDDDGKDASRIRAYSIEEKINV